MVSSLAEFVARWVPARRTESSGSKEHFLDLCDALEQAHPAAVDPTGEFFTFEKRVGKAGGGKGFADVWMKGNFAWEYKGPKKNLDEAYRQLLLYKDDLENPRLLVVCDFDRFEVHTNFTDTVKQVYAFRLEELLTPEPTRTCAIAPSLVLEALFREPERLRPQQTVEQVTLLAAREFALLAESLRKRGADPEEAARFLMRLLFCLFAEDSGLLPRGLFTRLVEGTRTRPEEFNKRVGQLFEAMAGGGSFGVEDILYFNGGLFTDDAALGLTAGDLEALGRASRLDWASVEPAIFGTLFERSLDPAKRSQLGAHYTSREDILLIVEPVLMEPLRRRWETVRERAVGVVERRDGAKDTASRTRLQNELGKVLMDFTDELAGVRVLDPACGSGNFLYVALKRLLDLEKEVGVFAASNGLSGMMPKVGPGQLYGIEVNVYAHELASVVVWIGYIQWLHDNGYGRPSEPILRPLDNIRQMDAILGYGEEGRPVEPEWPEADVIIGNPPFLGGSKIRRELGDDYAEALWKLYANRLPSGADLVCYWFELARALLEKRKARRAGLLATKSIREHVNRSILARIKETGDIFMAWSDRPWVLEGAAVRISMVGFDAGQEKNRTLDGQPVEEINASLDAGLDLMQAKQLAENFKICFAGTKKIGPFDITDSLAQHMLNARGNPNGRPNSDVIRPTANGFDVTRRPRNMWIIDFGVNMTEQEAAQYELPFEYVQEHVRPYRAGGRRGDLTGVPWWLHERTRPEMRAAIEKLPRFIATPLTSKYRLFKWLHHPTLPDQALFVFARADDYFFGLLHSRLHELWALRMGSTLEDRPQYVPTSRTFETFPFPWPPGSEPEGDERVEAIGEAARELVEKRDRWLNPEGTPLSEVELKKRTLTNLYNARPAWLEMAHKRLDEAVMGAYGWEEGLGDEEVLERLLGLNLYR